MFFLDILHRFLPWGWVPNLRNGCIDIFRNGAWRQAWSHGQGISKVNQMYLLQIWFLWHRGKERRPLRSTSQHHQWEDLHLYLVGSFYSPWNKSNNSPSASLETIQKRRHSSFTPNAPLPLSHSKIIIFPTSLNLVTSPLSSEDIIHVPCFKIVFYSNFNLVFQNNLT